ncbi:MAG: hypothetical protein ACN6PI_17700, partial [Sphingobacterium siyangense]
MLLPALEKLYGCSIKKESKKMENKRINGNDLIALGYKENHTLGVALKINSKRHGFTRVEILEKFKA